MAENIQLSGCVNIMSFYSYIDYIKKRTAARADVEENGEDRDESDDAEAQSAQELLDMLKDDYDQNNGKYSEHYIIDFYKKKITSLPCQNQGYVLDGYPKTYEQAKLLFGSKNYYCINNVTIYRTPSIMQQPIVINLFLFIFTTHIGN